MTHTEIRTGTKTGPTGNAMFITKGFHDRRYLLVIQAAFKALRTINAQRPLKGSVLSLSWSHRRVKAEMQREERVNSKNWISLLPKSIEHRKLTAEHSEIQMNVHNKPSTSDKVYHGVLHSSIFKTTTINAAPETPGRLKGLNEKNISSS